MYIFFKLKGYLCVCNTHKLIFFSLSSKSVQYTFVLSIYIFVSVKSWLSSIYMGTVDCTNCCRKDTPCYMCFASTIRFLFLGKQVYMTNFRYVKIYSAYLPTVHLLYFFLEANGYKFRRRLIYL